MAAGLGFKDFQTGEVLTAADVDGYLMQGIWVFASEAARNAAVTSPQEGNFAFTKDTNSLWYYTGSAWAASGATGDIEGVTAGTGISGGGTSGTVTITNSMATAIDAKGDLVVGTGADAFSRLAVGSNGTTLVADSAEATGLKWAAAAGGDFKLINTTSFSAVASQSVDNVFTSTYENYKLVINIFPTSTSDSTTLRLRASGSDTTTNYSSYRVGYNGSVVFGGANNTGTDDWYYGIDGISGSSSGCEVLIYRPNVADKTVFTALGHTATAAVQMCGGIQTDSTQFDGFKLAIISGTFTGNVSVYGLAK